MRQERGRLEVRFRSPWQRRRRRGSAAASATGPSEAREPLDGIRDNSAPRLKRLRRSAPRSTRSVARCTYRPSRSSGVNCWTRRVRLSLAVGTACCAAAQTPKEYKSLGSPGEPAPEGQAKYLHLHLAMRPGGTTTVGAEVLMATESLLGVASPMLHIGRVGKVHGGRPVARVPATAGYT